MEIHLNRTLEFNKFTLALAAASFGYAGQIATSSTGVWIKALGIVAIFFLAFATIFGAFVMGRATKLSDEKTNDALIKKLGRAHMTCLAIGLTVTGLLVISKILAGLEMSNLIE